MGSLSRYTQLLNPSDPSKAVVSFGESEKARKAVKAVFDVANRCTPADYDYAISALLRFERVI